jgi:hypothetical protein
MLEDSVISSVYLEVENVRVVPLLFGERKNNTTYRNIFWT